MKKLLFSAILTSVIALLPFAQSHASHLMGGEITVKHVGGTDYIVTANLYRDSLGINLPQTVNLGVYDHVSTANLPNVSLTNQLIIGVGYRTQKGVYSDTIQLASGGDYEISFSSCCRNGAISNITSPGSASLYLNARIMTGLPGGNSTPIFLNNPVVTALQGSLWNYNPLPFDADGDSLVYSLQVPLTAQNTPVNGYVLPSGSTPFTVDPLTGAITWTPNMQGFYQSSVLVEEFRNGVKIGEVLRDMQVIVFPPFTGNGGPSFTNTGGWSKNANNNFQFNVPAQSNFQLTVNVKDPDNDRIELSASGEPFGISQSPATFQLKAGFPIYEQEGTFIWEPDASSIRQEAYPVAFRKTEFINGASFSDDLTVLFQVDASVNTNVPNAHYQLQAYPNPATHQLNVGFYLSGSGETHMSLMNALGQVVMSEVHELNSGAQILPIGVGNLETGTYYLILSQDGVQSSIPVSIR